MTREEAILELQQLLNLAKSKELDWDFYDVEDIHITADIILCNLIETMVPNAKKILELYHSIPKWY